MPAITTRTRFVLAVVLITAVASGVAAYALTRIDPSPARTLLTWFWKLDYRVFPVKSEVKLAAIHRNASRDTREQCAACHDDKTNSKLVLHRIHLRSRLLARLQCHDCHQHVDLSRRDNKAVVTWVDVGFCRECHSAFPGLSAGSPMRPEDFESKCTICHKGANAPRHDRPYLPRTTPSSECKGCHGGRALPSAALHESPEWMKIHGAEALASGVDSCYRCHDFGLKFCQGCHDNKPPTHLPAERWRTIHASEARRDTRVCYSCHRTSYCKKCHLQHESGWLTSHPAFVYEKGDSSCGECHSASSCGYCHMQSSDALTQP